MHRGGTIMSTAEVFAFEQIDKFIAGKITRQETALLLQVHERTVTRLAREIREKGLLGIKHGNFQRRPKNKTPESLKAQVCSLLRHKYFDLNITHAKEILKKKHQIKVSYSTLRRWCHELHLVKRKHHRVKKKSRKLRPRSQREGFLLQMDGSPHMYNRHEEWTLIAAIDDATNEVPYAQFFETENLFNCMTVLEGVIRAKGIPWAVYVDRAGWLGGRVQAQFGDFVRACNDLGIEVIHANSPQAKGRIERWWQVPQDRLQAELRINGIRGIAGANTYLKHTFLKEYWNKQKTLAPRDPHPHWRPLPSDIDLNEIFTQREYRKINNDHTFQWRNGRFQILNPPGSIAGTEIEVRTYRTGNPKIFLGGRELMAELVTQEIKRIAS